MVALLVQNLERLDESVREEADGVHNTLGEGLAPINNQMGFGFFFFPYTPKLPFKNEDPCVHFM